MKIIALLTALLVGAVAHAHDSTLEEELAQAREKMEEAAKIVATKARRIATEAKRAFSERAFLGVLIKDQDAEGVRIAGVSPDGGAEEAGLEADDVIVDINGVSLLGDDHPAELLHSVLDAVTPGDSVDLTVVRDGESLSFAVVTTPYLEHAGRQAFRLHDVIELLPDWPEVEVFSRVGATGGLRLVDIGEDLGAYFGVDAGVLVLDTPAKSELRPGDILKRIDGADVSSARQARRQLARQSEDAEVQVRRKNRNVTVTVAAAPRGRVVELDDDVDVNVDVIELRDGSSGKDEL